MRRNHAEAQARYRARQSLKLAFFDRMDAERVQHLRRVCPWGAYPGRPEPAAVQAFLENHPSCFQGVKSVELSSSWVSGIKSPRWCVTFSPEPANSRQCAAVALAALASVTSLPAVATNCRGETFGPDDPAVKQAQAEIAEMKRLGIWERHA